MEALSPFEKFDYEAKVSNYKFTDIHLPFGRFSSCATEVAGI